MLRPAPDGRRHLQGRRLAGRAPAFKAEAAPLHAGQAQQGPGKGEAQREDKTGIARAQAGNLAPAIQRSAHPEHLRMPGGLKHDGIRRDAVGHVRHDISIGMPADALNAGHKAIRPHALDELDKTGLLPWSYGVAAPGKDLCILAPLSLQQFVGHGPGVRVPGKVVPAQEGAPTVSIIVKGLADDPQRRSDAQVKGLISLPLHLEQARILAGLPNEKVFRQVDGKGLLAGLLHHPVHRFKAPGRVQVVEVRRPPSRAGQTASVPPMACAALRAASTPGFHGVPSGLRVSTSLSAQTTISLSGYLSRTRRATARRFPALKATRQA